jgi:hypothetical protein
VTGTNFSEAGLSAGNYYYMVRAVKMQTTPSGSYFNPSQGIFCVRRGDQWSFAPFSGPHRKYNSSELEQ